MWSQFLMIPVSWHKLGIGAVRGLMLCLWLLFLTNYYVSSTTLNLHPLPALFLNLAMVGFTYWRPRRSVYLLLVALPWIDGFFNQLNILSGRSFLFPNHLSLDLLVGFSFSYLCLVPLRHQFVSGQGQPTSHRWLALTIIGFSLFASLSSLFSIRASHLQSGSSWSASGFIWNLMYFRNVGWFDDYYSIFEMVTHLLIVPFSVAIFHFKSQYKPHLDDCIKPLILSSILCFIYGISQLFSGFGIPQALQGRGVTSFFADNHLYGSFILAMILLNIMYLRSDGRLSRRSKCLSATSLLLAIINLSLIGSRSSLIISLLILLPLSLKIAYDLKASRRFKVLSVILCLLGCLVYLWFSYKNFAPNLTWLTQLTSLTNFDAFNRFLTFRPEIYLAAWRLFSFNPWFGIGKGSFFRISSIDELTKSQFLTGMGGENAHNFFLQVLTEMGLSGFLLLWLPIIMLCLGKDSSKKPLRWFLLGIFLTNQLAHSLLLANFLFLSIAVLIYAMPDASSTKESSSRVTKFLANRRPSQYIIAYLCLCLAAAWNSFAYADKFPPSADHFFCYRDNQQWSDGFVSGRYSRTFHLKENPLNLEIQAHHPDIERRAVGVKLVVTHNRQIVQSHDYVYKNNEPRTLSYQLPAQLLGQELTLSLEVSHCYTPKNRWGSQDQRHLGVILRGLN